VTLEESWQVQGACQAACGGYLLLGIPALFKTMSGGLEPEVLDETCRGGASLLNKDAAEVPLAHGCPVREMLKSSCRWSKAQILIRTMGVSGAA